MFDSNTNSLPAPKPGETVTLPDGRTGRVDTIKPGKSPGQFGAKVNLDKGGKALVEVKQTRTVTVIEETP